MAVVGAGKPVPHNVAGGHFDRGGAGVGGERGRGAESIDGADPAEDLARGQSTDAAQFGESCAGGGDGGLDVGAGLGDAAVQLAYLGDQRCGWTRWRTAVSGHGSTVMWWPAHWIAIARSGPARSATTATGQALLPCNIRHVVALPADR